MGATSPQPVSEGERGGEGAARGGALRGRMCRVGGPIPHPPLLPPSPHITLPSSRRPPQVLPTHGRAIDPRPLLARHTAATLIAARARARLRHHGRTSLALAAVAGAALLLLTVGAVTAGGGGGRGQWAASAWRSPLLPSASMHVDVSRRRGKTATPPADARAASLAAVASLKTLFEQQRLAAPRAERTTPTAAHLRAAAGAALNAAAAPVAADLAAEREAATAAVRATLEARQLGGDCSRLLVGSVNKGCGFACQVNMRGERERGGRGEKGRRHNTT